MKTLSRQEVNQKLEANEAVLVEVLAADKYADFHLPGAVNVPLDDDFEVQIQETIPDKSAPVVVYCYDTECQASEKAAQRMEALGYQNVYDYEAGKVDWKEAGLPVED